MMNDVLFDCMSDISKEHCFMHAEWEVSQEMRSRATAAEDANDE